MSAEEKMDAIIIGAGPAGIACAYALAKQGREVLLIERGASAGDKNFTGGRMYGQALDMLDPGLTAKAFKENALERRILHEQIMCLSKESSITVDYRDALLLSGLGGDPDYEALSYSVLHSRFNAWFAQKAEDLGVIMACGVRVDGLVEEKGKIVGVKAGEDLMYAQVVIAADGVNSFIAQEAGLKPSVHGHSVGVGIKEVIELPESTIEDRFGLLPGTGAARVVLGCTSGIAGGGAIYTNKKSISLACVYNPAAAAGQKQRLPDLFQQYKLHPCIRQLIEGGSTVEYGAHLVMENGWRDVMKKPWREGLLVAGEAAGYVINTGVLIRGIDLAILSGLAAAKAVLSNKQGVDLGKAYCQQLEDVGLNQAMRATRNWPDFMASPRLYQAYPDMGVDMLRQLFTLQKAPLGKRLFGSLRKHTSIGGLAKDMWKAVKAL